MNAAFLILWIVVFIILVIFIIAAIRNVQQVSDNKNIYVVNFNQDTCYPNGNADNLPVLENSCCVVDGETTSKRRYFLESANLNFLVDTYPVSYASVCYDFCQNIDAKTGRCLDTLADYPVCIQALKPPVGCLDYALPLAQVKGTPYYAQQPYVPAEANNVGNCPTVVNC